MEELIPITMFISIAAVLILRPVTKRLGGLLEAMTRERTEVRTQQLSEARIVALLEQMSRRLDMMDERVDFTERLITTRRPETRRDRRVLADHDASALTG